MRTAQTRTISDNQDFQGAMLSYASLEARVPPKHQLRKLHTVVDALLATMNSEFEAIYALRERSSVPPEPPLKALQLQILFSVCIERQMVEAVNYNPLCHWLVGLTIEDKVWDHSTFSATRQRQCNKDLTRALFDRIKLCDQWGKLASDEHFFIDGVLIETCTSHKNFKRKNHDGSSTDADAHLSKKSRGEQSHLSHMVQILMENRNGLIVGVETPYASGTAKSGAAPAILARRSKKQHTRASLGADKGYKCNAFFKRCRKRHVNRVAANHKYSALDARVTRQNDYMTSLQVRKHVE